MSDVQQATVKTPKMISKRRTWVQERRQVQIDRRTAEQPDPGVEVDTISGAPSSTGAQRRASVQDTSTTTTLLTPPTASEEWSTKSCPPSAIRITLNPPAPTPIMPEPIEAALEVNTSDIIEIASQTATKDMFGLDSTISKHTTEPSAGVAPNTSEQQTYAGQPQLPHSAIRFAQQPFAHPVQTRHTVS